jgi:predicted ferric reductase
VTNEIWWYVSRASGLVAWGLLTLAVCWGVALSTHVLGRKHQPSWLLAVHRFLGGLSLMFVALHVVAVVADSHVDFGWADVLVPVVTRWRAAAVWGIVAMYMLLAVELTSLMMKRLPKRLWRGIHFVSFVLYAMSNVHAILAGQDVHSMLYRVVALAAIQVVTFLCLVRILYAGQRATQLADRRVRERRADAVERIS